MIDFYILTAIINIIWQIFTILFVLYRFTTFFSLIFNFTKFLGKLLQGGVYIKDNIQTYFRTRNALPETITTKPKTLFSKLQDWFCGTNSKSEVLPLFETRTSFAYNDNDNENDNESHMNLNSNDFDNRHQMFISSHNFESSFEPTSEHEYEFKRSLLGDFHP